MSNRPSFVHRRRLATSAAVLACTLAAVPATDAAVVTIDLGPSGFNLLGANGGASSGAYSTATGFPLPSGTMYVANGLNIGNGGMFGLWTAGNLSIATAGIGVLRKFAAGDSISSAGWIDGSISETVFRWSISSAQADFGPNSFIGFRFQASPGNYNYGFIEVTWTAATNTFGILSAAYESTANTAITAPASGGGGGGVPLPGAAGLAACGLLAAARRRRR